MKLFDWLNQSVYVDILNQQAAASESLPVDRTVEVELLKQQMGTAYLCHKSNQVQRVDGKKYGQAPKVKLRKVN